MADGTARKAATKNAFAPPPNPHLQQPTKKSTAQPPPKNATKTPRAAFAIIQPQHQQPLASQHAAQSERDYVQSLLDELEGGGDEVDELAELKKQLAESQKVRLHPRLTL